VYDAEPAEIIKIKNQSKADFEFAILLYSQKEFTQAKQILEKILKSNIQDRAAMMYIERCEYYQNYGVPQEWSGIEDFN
jgi:two-component system sensor histidine kinase ChiS